MLVGVLEVDVGCHEIVLHHQDGIDNLRGASHPALMTRHRLRGADEGALALEHPAQCDGLKHITLMRRGGVGVDVVDIVGYDTCILHGNSITDFADNIRSIRNVWMGSTSGSATTNSFHSFFANVNQASVNSAVENAFTSAINNISGMPAPFVKYCSVVSGKNFDDQSNWESTSGE